MASSIPHESSASGAGRSEHKIEKSILSKTGIEKTTEELKISHLPRNKSISKKKLHIDIARKAQEIGNLSESDPFKTLWHEMGKVASRVIVFFQKHKNA